VFPIALSYSYVNSPRSNGHMRIVKLLLRAGAAVNSENPKGQVGVLATC
jgi:ankyrin repeat protein